MKKLIAFLFAVALVVTAVHAKDIAFDAPVNASNYSAGAGTVAKIKLLSINYETGTYRFQLLDAGGNVVAGGAVFGVHDDTPDEDRVKAAVLAAIQATQG
jgi:hypothetical protein